MRKAIATVLSLIVFPAGVMLEWSWAALDVLGRIMTGLDLSGTFDRFIDWLAAHPWVAVDIGPWLLIVAGLASIALIHRSLFGRIIVRVSRHPPSWATKNNADSKPTASMVQIVAGQSSPANRRRPIVAGQDYPLLTTYFKEDGSFVATYGVMVQNVSGRNLTDCRLYLDGLTPNPLGHEKILLTPQSFALMPGESKSVSVAYLSSSTAESCNTKPNVMGISTLDSSIYQDVSKIQMPIGSYLLRLQVTRMEAHPYEAAFQLIGENTACD